MGAPQSTVLLITLIISLFSFIKLKLFFSSRSQHDELLSFQSFDLDSCGTIEDFPGTIVLGRPTKNEIYFSLLSEKTLSQVRIQADPLSFNSPTVWSEAFQIEASSVTEIQLSSLQPDCSYVYTVVFTEGNITHCSNPHNFQTYRSPGSAFRFSVIADSHLGTSKHCNVERYKQTLRNVHADNPDFVISLGDDFRATTLKAPVTELNVRKLYEQQRPFFSIFAQDAALYNVNGNHELQAGWALDWTENNVALWAINNRLLYYPNPRPNEFYSGDATRYEKVAKNGILENYYAWLWGDALFITLDNYLFSNLDEIGWGSTLGLKQFNWLKTVLTTEANFKFLFHHHMCAIARGGIEWADFYEWGGQTKTTGSFASGAVWEFTAKRPGWGNLPIHQLLVKNGVDVVFQGHDHLYVKQDHPDGIIYLTLPQPGFKPDNFWGNPNDNSNYYSSGVIRAPSGHISVDVSEHTATISYVLSKISGDSTSNGVNQEVAHSFTIEKNKVEESS